MADPFQQFIETYMGVQQFNDLQQQQLEQQRQFDAQEALAQQQADLQAVTGFSTLLSKVANRDQAVALSHAYALQRPDLAPIFENLSTAIVPSLETQTSAAAQGLPPGTLGAGLTNSLGVTLTAGQQEGKRQFGVTSKQTDRELDLRNKSIGVQNRQIDAQEAISAAGEANDRLRIFGSAGMLAVPLRGQLSQDAAKVQAQMQNPNITPGAKARLKRQLDDLNAQIGRFDARIAADQKGGATDPFSALNANQLVVARGAAMQDIMDAPDEGTKQAATEAYNQLSRALGLGTLDFSRNWFNRGNGSTDFVPVPTDSTTRR